MTTSPESHRTRRISSGRRSSSASSVSSRITTLSKRSPSPIIFTPAQLAPDTKGPKLQDITRQVFQSLEGTGYFRFFDAHSSITEDEEEQQVHSSLTPPDPSPIPPATSAVSAAAQPTSVRHRNGDGTAKQSKKVDWEIPRKALHSSIGFGTLYLYTSQASPHTVVIALWSALAIILPADFIRFRSTRFEKVYEKVLGFLMRESEKSQINGVVWYILGVNLALTFYPLDVAAVAILILSWADTAASTVGRMWGSKTPPLPRSVLGLPFAPRKSLAGFLAACVTGAAIAASFWTWVAPLRSNQDDITWSWQDGVRPMIDTPIPAGYSASLTGPIGIAAIGAIAGLVSGVAEALDLPGSLDDNLTLPVISGGFLFLFFRCLSLFA